MGDTGKTAIFCQIRFLSTIKLMAFSENNVLYFVLKYNECLNRNRF